MRLLGSGVLFELRLELLLELLWRVFIIPVCVPERLLGLLGLIVCRLDSVLTTLRRKSCSKHYVVDLAAMYCAIQESGLDVCKFMIHLACVRCGRMDLKYRAARDQCPHQSGNSLVLADTKQQQFLHTRSWRTVRFEVLEDVVFFQREVVTLGLGVRHCQGGGSTSLTYAAVDLPSCVLYAV